eukprot:g61147.t1
MGSALSKPLWDAYTDSLRTNPLTTQACTQLLITAFTEKVGKANSSHLLQSSLFASMAITPLVHLLKLCLAELPHPLLKLAFTMLLAIPLPIFLTVFARRFWLQSRPAEPFSLVWHRFLKWAQINCWRTLKWLWIIYLPVLAFIRRYVPENGRTLVLQLFTMLLHILGGLNKRRRDQARRLAGKSSSRNSSKNNSRRGSFRSLSRRGSDVSITYD